MCDSNRDSEVANGTVNIKDVKTQQQYTVPMEELIPTMDRIFGNVGCGEINEEE